MVCFSENTMQVPFGPFSKSNKSLTSGRLYSTLEYAQFDPEKVRVQLRRKARKRPISIEEPDSDSDIPPSKRLKNHRNQASASSSPEHREVTAHYGFSSSSSNSQSLISLGFSTPERFARRRLKSNVSRTRSNSKVTPWVFSLAKKYYPNNLDEITSSGTHKTAIFKNEPIWKYKNLKGFNAGTISETTYFPGDYVLIGSKKEESLPRGNAIICEEGGIYSENGMSNDTENSRYARIVYLYSSEDGEPMAHLRWFEPGIKTVLGEFADLHELFLLDECSNETLYSITRKIQVSRRVGLVGEINDGAYFYRLRYEKVTQKFIDATDHLEETDGSRRCQCCVQRMKVEETNMFQTLGAAVTKRSKTSFEGVRLRGATYNLNDFVFIAVESGKPYIIGQLQKIYMPTTVFQKRQERLDKRIEETDVKIKISVYEKYDTLIPGWFAEHQNKTKPLTRDERRLYFTRKIMKASVNALDGKCIIRHNDSFENEIDKNNYKDQHESNFWVADKIRRRYAYERPIRVEHLRRLGRDRFEANQHSKVHPELHISRMKALRESGKKLRGLDVFGGGGGLTEGLQMSGAVDALHLVDFEIKACKTAKRNHPKITCHNADASVLLERALRRQSGETLERQFDEEGNEVPDLPAPGEIDFLYGGPPCPGYSAANTRKKSDDILNTLTSVFLSYLDFYRPKYFLLENVKGFLEHKLGARQINEKRIEGGIEKGTIKLVLRAITGLGYQVEYALLQAAEYGTPSSRCRIFFWASLPGNPLPGFPQPRNIVRDPRFRANPCVEAQWWRTNRSAAHLDSTIGDAISDLPEFEYKSSCILKAGERSKDGEKNIQGTKISSYIGDDCTPHTQKPRSEYQRRAREELPNVINHVTRVLLPRVVDCICHVPVRPGANYEDIEDTSVKSSLQVRKSQSVSDRSSPVSEGPKPYSQRFQRLDSDKVSRAFLTVLNPNGRYGAIVHPTQNRIISVREMARLMGFRDSFSFDFEEIAIVDAIRQLGNAVPPTLAKALGDELLKVLI